MWKQNEQRPTTTLGDRFRPFAIKKIRVFTPSVGPSLINWPLRDVLSNVRVLDVLYWTYWQLTDAVSF